MTLHLSTASPADDCVHRSAKIAPKRRTGEKQRTANALACLDLERHTVQHRRKLRRVPVFSAFVTNAR